MMAVVAPAIRFAGACGYTCEGALVFCDDARVSADLRCEVCDCKRAAEAAINALEFAGAIICAPKASAVPNG